MVKHYAEDLGFKYLSAENQTEFRERMSEFFDESSNRSIILECFVDQKDEFTVWEKMSSVEICETPATFRFSVGKILPKGIKRAIKSAIHAT